MDAKSRWGGKIHDHYLHGREVFPTVNLLIVNNCTVEKQSHFDWVIKFNIFNEGKMNILSLEDSITRTQHHLCRSLTDNT